MLAATFMSSYGGDAHDCLVAKTLDLWPTADIVLEDLGLTVKLPASAAKKRESIK